LGVEKEDASPLLSFEPWAMDVSGTGRLLLERFTIPCWLFFSFCYLDAKESSCWAGYLSWMDDLGYLAMDCVVEEWIPEVWKEIVWQTQDAPMKTLGVRFLSSVHLTTLLGLCQDICCRMWVSVLDLGFKITCEKPSPVVKLGFWSGHLPVSLVGIRNTKCTVGIEGLTDKTGADSILLAKSVLCSVTVVGWHASARHFW